jgi:hypothetical protein
VIYPESGRITCETLTCATGGAGVFGDVSYPKFGWSDTVDECYGISAGAWKRHETDYLRGKAFYGAELGEIKR